MEDTIETIAEIVPSTPTDRFRQSVATEVVSTLIVVSVIATAKLAGGFVLGKIKARHENKTTENPEN